MKKTDPMKTPVMEQFQKIKDKYPDCILFFRMGDFYEMFLEDAKVASSILDIALTKRQNEIPMCGIPYHAMDNYSSRILKAGHKIAVCEQEKNTDANAKIMQRKVVRVLTPGTLVEENLLAGKSSNYICAAYFNDKQSRIKFKSRERKNKNSTDKQGQVATRSSLPAIYLILLDISTGDFFWTSSVSFQQKENDIAVAKESSSYSGKNANWFSSQLEKYRPGEILYVEDQSEYLSNLDLASYYTSPLPLYAVDSIQGERRLKSLFNLESLSALELQLKNDSPFFSAVNMLFTYLDITSTQSVLPHISWPKLIIQQDYMQLDEQSIKHLDLLLNYSELSKERTLFSIMNTCMTTAGKRFLERRIMSPWLHKKDVLQAKNNTTVLHEKADLLIILRKELAKVSDLERVLSRFSLGRAYPRDFASIINSITAGLTLKELCKNTNLSFSFRSSRGLQKLQNLLMDKLQYEDLPTNLHQSRLLRTGFMPELDELYRAKTDGGKMIWDFQKKESEKLGASTLKVKYNKVIGYFIELSKREANNIPEDYIRRQTLVGSERYSCMRLQKIEQTLLSAEDKIREIEEELFSKLIEQVLEHSSTIRGMMNFLSKLDYFSTLADIAIQRNWTPAEIAEEGTLEIEEGRHPVVEYYLEKSGDIHGNTFIANSLKMNSKERQLAILTGPNMAGKSTFIRQTALIQLLFQMGSFVPAKKAKLPLVDKIYTRIGASDNLSRGQSTFLVEMLETAGILRGSTNQSLVLMDEVGRGTSTYDGMALAWAISNYLNGENKENKRPLTLFATHYHELTSLSGKDGIFNLTMDVAEMQEEIIFLRSVIDGIAHKSYGIHVAKMAGLPPTVIKTATAILDNWENQKQNTTIASNKKKSSTSTHQLELFQEQKNANDTPTTNDTSILPNLKIQTNVEIDNFGYEKNKQNKTISENEIFILQELTKLQIDNITPLQALSIIQSWKDSLQGKTQ